MREFQASDAKTHLPQILDSVERGQTVRITRRGRPIARLVPETDCRQSEVDQALSNIRALRGRVQKLSLDEIHAFRHEGRKY